MNYRPPPPQMTNTQLSQVNSWCRYDPAVCAKEVGIEAAFLVASYCALIFLTGGPVPGVWGILKFIATFVVLSLAARMVSDDLGNKVSITAVSGLGAKTVSFLAPKFVGW